MWPALRKAEHLLDRLFRYSRPCNEIPAGVQSGWHMHPSEEVGCILAEPWRCRSKGSPP